MSATIPPRKCPECGSTTYMSGTLGAHYAAIHPSKAQRMVPTEPAITSDEKARAYWACKCGRGGRWAQWHYRFDHR